MYSNVFKSPLFLLSVIILIGLSGLPANAGVINVTKYYNENSLSFDTTYSPDDADTFEVILYCDTVRYNYDEGKPQLPVFGYQVVLPNGASVDSVTYTISNPQFVDDIHGGYQLYPCQEYPVSGETSEWVDPDSAAYSDSSSSVVEQAWLVTQGKFDGFIPFAKFNICPFEYFPAQDSLLIYGSVEVTVHYTTDQAEVPPERSILSQRVYEDVYDEAVVENDADKSSSGYWGSYVPQPRSKWSASPLESNYPHRYYEYSIVVSGESIAEALKDFVTWKRQKGVDCGIVFADSIRLRTSNPEIDDNAGYLRTWIRAGYDSGLVTYVMLAGDPDIDGDDVTQVPVRYGHFGNSEAPNWPDTCMNHGIDLSCPNWQSSNPEDCCAPFWVPSDFYFTELNNDWDVDNDDFYGEAPWRNPETGQLYAEEMLTDGYGEVFVGRVPTDSADLIRNWVSKLITYEKNPGLGDYSYLQTVLSTQADDPQVMKHAQRMHQWLPSGWEKHIIEEEDSGFCCTSEYPESEDIPDSINAARPHFITNHCHGGLDHIKILAQGQACHNFYGMCGLPDSLCESDRFWAYSPSAGDLWDIDVGPYYGIWSGANCHTGNYARGDHDEDLIQCFGAMFLFVPDRGGVGYMGNARVGMWYCQFKGMEHFIRIGFGDNMTARYGERFGPAFDASRAMVVLEDSPYNTPGLMRFHKYYMTYHLLGDPEMSLWGKEPEHFRVDVVQVSVGDDTIKVNKLNDQAYNDAYVCVNYDDTSYYVDFTDANGLILLPDSIHNLNGEELITVTAPNMIPCQVFGHKVLTDDVLWTGDYTICDSVIVADSVKLTIHPGSNIRFKRDAFLRVYGELEAVDDSIWSVRQIVFSADTASAAVRDFWKGINVCYNSVIDFKNCSVINSTYGLYVDRPLSCEIKNCRLSNNNYHGLYIKNWQDEIPFLIEGCHIDSNTVYGIKAYGYNHFVFDTLIDNDGYGYYRDSSGADSLINCIIERHDGEVNNDWGVYISTSGEDKYTYISGGRVSGYRQGGIKVIEADSQSVIGGGIEVDSNGYYGIYLDNTDATIEGVYGITQNQIDSETGTGIYLHYSDATITGDSMGFCTDVSLQPFGVVNYRSEPQLRLINFSNSIIDLWTTETGEVTWPNTTVDTSCFDGDSIYIRNDHANDTLIARHNYFEDTSSYRFAGNIDISDTLDSSPCSGGGAKWAAYDGLPRAFALRQNYPNPFNPTTMLKYQLPKDCYVKLTVYNILGQKVVRLVDEYQTTGFKEIIWDGRNSSGNEVATGVYFYLMEADDFRKAKKMLMLK